MNGSNIKIFGGGVKDREGFVCNFQGQSRDNVEWFCNLL